MSNPEFGGLICEFPTFVQRCGVSAVQIQAVIPNPRGHEVHFAGEQSFVPVQVTEGWVLEHNPRPSDWMVFRYGAHPIVVSDVVFSHLFTPVSEV